MPVIWAAISGHGYGHAAQVIPVLNALGQLVPNLTAILRTTVPGSFFQDRLRIPWSLQAIQQDVGCVQQGPMQIDVGATWEAHRQFHAQWEERVAQEVKAIRSAAPQVTIADTPYLAVCASSEARIPTVSLANLTWNEILEPFADASEPHHEVLLSDMAHYYSLADRALRITPGLRLSPIRHVTDIGPIAEPALPQRAAIRADLKIPDTDRLVLIGFGGVPLASLPWDAMERMPGYRFIVDEAPSGSASTIVPMSSLRYTFKTLLASVDIIMTKPGYGTVVEAVAARVPVVYVRRYNFADEQPLVDFLTQYGRSCELSLEDFQTGRWQPAYEALQEQPIPPNPPPCTGASDAAVHLRKYF